MSGAIVLTMVLSALAFSCSHPKDHQVSPQEINSLSQDLGIKDGESRVKVLSPQTSAYSNFQGSTIIINATNPSPPAMAVNHGPSSLKPSASPGFKTTASNPDSSSPKGSER